MKPLLILLALFVSTPSFANGGDDCVSVAQQALEARGIHDYQKPDIEPVLNHDGDEIGYEFWFRLDHCAKGYVVVKTLPTCYIQTIYARGGCQIGSPLPAQSEGTEF